MIIQGSNLPIELTFENSMSTILDIEVSLINMASNKEIMHWSKADVTISNKKIVLPISQKESVTFPAGKCKLEIKWMDYEGKTNFAKDIPEVIGERSDKTIMEGAR